MPRTKGSKNKKTRQKGQGRGWFGDSQEHAQVGSLGGQSQGAWNNPGNFANDREKARQAGEEGGSK